MVALASVEARLIPVAGGAGFSILASASSAAATVPVSVDTATCAACLAEVDEPADRCFATYPFDELHGLPIARSSSPSDQDRYALVGFTSAWC